MHSLISGEQSFILWGVLLAMVALALWLEETRIGQKLSGTIIIIMMGLLLSNIGVIPNSAPVYHHIWSVLVPLSIPLLLVKADLHRIIKESGPMLLAFILGAIGTTIGAGVAYYLVPLPALQAQLTSIYTASFIGGSMNFAAVASALDVAGEPIIVPALAADNLIAILYLLVLAWVPASLFFQKLYAHKNQNAEDIEEAHISLWGPFSVKHAVSALAVAYAIVWVGNQLDALIQIQGTAIISITAISVLLASLFGKYLRQLTGIFQLGMLIMYLFFGSIGASANIWVLIETAPSLILFLITLTTVHFVIIFTFGRFLNLSLAEVITASNACVLGPTTAAGVAASKGWGSLITPAILLGVFGYAIANFVGLAVWNFIQ